MPTAQPARKKAGGVWPAYLDRKTRNKIVRDWLTFNLQLDHANGRTVSPDVAPYKQWNKEAVERLMRDFDPSPPQATPAPPRRRRKARPQAPAAAQAAADDFVPDTVDDLWRS